MLVEFVRRNGQAESGLRDAQGAETTLFCLIVFGTASGG